MRLNLFSLAPDSFILGPPSLLSQFYPKKVLDIPDVKNFHNKSYDFQNTSTSSGKPWGLEIHLTSNCPLSCLHCSYGKRNQDLSELSPEVLSKIFVSIQKFNFGSVIFSGGGDPLAWGAGTFNDLLKADANYSQAIATNGLGLSKALNKDLLNRIDIIQINVNGYDMESFQKTTQKDRFDKFLENIEWVLKNRDKNITQITGKIVIDNQNYKLAQKYLEFCHQIGFDLVVVKLAGNFEAHQNVSLDQSQKQELRELIYASSIIDKYPEYLDAIATQDNSVELNLPNKCWVVEYGMYMLIRSNGDVFPCVTSPYCQENSIGNLYQQNLDEIWGQIKHQEIKNKLHYDMKCGKCNLCVCRHMRYNFLLDDAICSTKYIESLPATKKNKPKLL